ncbi:hypothetical protein HDU92_001972 [Lobulomyces angularis]|nr:hypothetical protein HDU92_001972 [Lobulomyces angularis]
MEWWDDLWLNEGFATFIASLALEKFFPTWNAWNMFLTNEYSFALQLDSLLSSHPIHANVNNANEVNSIFDAITYDKASALIRMLNFALGTETFMKGIRSYLKKFIYANAKVEDLWEHLSQASGKNVSAMAHKWVYKTGYPVISIISESYDEDKKELTLELKQTRYFKNGELTDASNTIWEIPLSLITHERKDFDFTMTKANESITFSYNKGPESFFKLNHQCRGFFRVDLDIENITTLAKKNLEVSDRIGIISDCFAMAACGSTKLSDALNVVIGFKKEENVMVLREIYNQLSTLESVSYNNVTHVNALNKLMGEIFSPKVETLGWEYSDQDDNDTIVRRTLSITSCGISGVKSVVEEYLRRIKLFLSGDEKILHPNLVPTGLVMFLRHSTSPQNDFEKIFSLAKSSKSEEITIGCYRALGAINSEETLTKFFNEQILDVQQVSASQLTTVLLGITNYSPISNVSKPLLWKWLVKNWDTLYSRFINTPGAFATVVKICVRTLVGEESETLIKSWLKGDGLTDDLKLKRLEEIKLAQPDFDQSLEQVTCATSAIKKYNEDLNAWAALEISKNELREVLCSDVKPTHYVVDITPNFESFIFNGVVDIHLTINENLKEITCNANELDIQAASIIIIDFDPQKNLTQVATKIDYDKKFERVTFTFNDTISKGAKAILNLKFTGKHNDNMVGFYRSGFKKDNQQKWLLVTQFEACDCRRAFPCWDEPSLKATFDVILRVPRNMTALSNMNVIETFEENDLIVSKYAKTPIMSTYLVAFAVGELDFIEATANPQKPADAKPITVRVYTNKGESEMGRFSLEVAARTLEYFSEYFDCAYPLSKMDMISVPDFSAGAMENWGLVTYRSVILLCDEKTTSAIKQQIAYVVCHELAHQWFGNLVTMEWWDALWLNEGFATFVGWLAVDHLFPEWDIWTSFLNAETFEALELDSLRSSHPIEVTVNSPSEISQIFDAISYSKGASIIQMLSWSIGQEVFTNGVRSYLKEFSYSNAKTNDLWRHLLLASGKDVELMMENWTRKMGYPVINVISETYDEEKKEMTLHLKQNRFLSSGEEDLSEQTVWWIPLGLVTDADPDNPLDHIMTSAEQTITFAYKKTATSYWKLNYKCRSFYRVNLSFENLDLLSKSPLSIADRVGVVGDAFSMAKAGFASTSSALKLVENYTNEDEYVALTQIASNLNAVLYSWYNESSNVQSAVNALRRSIFSKKVAKVGWEYPAGEGQIASLKRTLILSAAAKAGDHNIVQEFRARIKKVLTGDQDALNFNLISPGFSIFMRTSTNPEEDFDLIFNYFKTSTVEELRLAALSSIGSTNSADILKKFLYTTALDVQVIRPQDLIYVTRGFLQNSPIPEQVRPLTWKWMIDKWDLIHERYADIMGLFGVIVQSCVSYSVGDDFAEEVQNWYTGALLSTSEEKEKRALQVAPVISSFKQSLERVYSNTKWVKASRSNILEWAQLHKSDSIVNENLREVLSDIATPTHYVVDLTPNFDTFKYKGKVTISIDLKKNTKTLTFHAIDIELISAQLINGDNLESSTNFKYDTKLQTVTVEFLNEVTVGKGYKLKLEFIGHHSDKLAGFYRSSTTVDGVKKWMLSSQHESADCRRSFPCFDEPALKATFDIILRVSKGLTALSNTAVKKQYDENDLAVFEFSTTPVISTYLVAFAVGEFHYLEAVATPKKPDNAKPITVRVYTSIYENIEQGHFSLAVAVKTLEFFSEYFDIAYPLNKLDMLGAFDFSMGGMENWGLICYRNSALLFDEINGSSSNKQNITSIVSHEIAHQWFGNLVTPKWWNDLWLKEGFANFACIFMDYLHPEWDIWTATYQFDTMDALKLDSLQSSHPIEAIVNNPLECGTIFDVISYDKGYGVLRMLHGFLGEEVFKSGIRSYLKEFSYSNAETSDLWNHMSKASGKDVAFIMSNWTKKMGYPVVTIESEFYDEEKKEMTLTLRQNQYFSTGAVEVLSPVWCIPIGIFTNTHPKPFDLIFTKEVEIFTFPYENTATSFYKLNYKSQGFFRVNIKQEPLMKISKLVASGDAELSVLDRVGLLSDSFAMGVSGYASILSALDVIKNFKNEKNPIVIEEMVNELDLLKGFWYNRSPATINGFDVLKRSILLPRFHELGWDFNKDESDLVKLNRALVIDGLAKVGEISVVEELKTRFTLYIAGDQSALPANLIAPAFSAVLRNATDSSEFDTLVKLYPLGDNEKKRHILTSLPYTNQVELLRKLLNELIFDENFCRSVNMYQAFFNITKSPAPFARDALFEMFQRKFEELNNKLSSSSSVNLRNKTFAMCLESSVGSEFLSKLQNWYQVDLEKSDSLKQLKKDIETIYLQATETVKYTSALVERENSAVENWVKKNLNDIKNSTSSSEIREVLPLAVVPSHYVVDLTANFDTFRFIGNVLINLTIKEETSRISCNAVDLKIFNAQVTINDTTTLKAEHIIQHKSSGTVTFTFKEKLPKGKASMVINFEGTHSDSMSGFYRSGFMKDGEKKWMLVSQHEACDCRKSFPCWDEPALKATFDVILRVPKGFTALSNTNVIEEFEENNLTVSKFATTPVMSTYLVAFVVGELDYVETTSKPLSPPGSKPIVVRVYTNKGESAGGVFAAGVAEKTLEFFSEYFDIAYPLPKLDMVAVPDFAAGAMENWGLVTYRTVALLYDEKKSSQIAKQRCAYIVGHELAHQWFGNLVTMKWWNDLWLNEGFATFVGWLAVDHIFPEWDIWTQFADSVTNTALNMDSLRSSHPIEVSVNKPSEILQIFDAISYMKGASVIRMLYWALGETVFKSGVRTYLREFSYSNADTSDLWRHLSVSSGKDVAELMNSWTSKIGFPMLTVLAQNYDAERKEMTLELKQGRYLSSGDWSEAEENDVHSTVWWIPLGIITSTNSEPGDLLLTTKKGSVTFPYEETENSFWKINFKTRGFYRVKLEVPYLEKLSKNINQLCLTDKCGLVADAFSAASSGQGSTVACLELIKSLKNENEHIILSTMLVNLGNVISIWDNENPAVKEKLNSLKKLLVTSKVNEVGWEFPENENQQTSFKRTLVLSAAGKAGDQSVIKEFQSRFKKFIEGDESALHPSIQGPAFSVVLRNAEGREEFDSLLKILKETSSQEKKLSILTALGATKSIELAKFILSDVLLNLDYVRTQDVYMGVAGLSRDSPISTLVKPLLWKWLTENYDLIVERFRDTMSLFGHIISFCISGQRTFNFINEVEKWSLGEDCLTEADRKKRLNGLATVDGKLKQTLEQMKVETKWLEKDRRVVEDWLMSQNF